MDLNISDKSETQKLCNVIKNATKVINMDIDTITTHRFSFICKVSLTIIVKEVMANKAPKIIKAIPRYRET